MIFQLAEKHYRVANLYDTLLTHYTLTRTGDVLGKNFDYQFTYAHSAYAAYLANPTGYRYVTIPDGIGLGDPELNPRYEPTGIVVPGLHSGRSSSVVLVPASRVTWGLTVLKNAPNEANAIRFLQMLLGADGVAIQRSVGPEPIAPAGVSQSDYRQVPLALRDLVRPVHWEPR